MQPHIQYLEKIEVDPADPFVHVGFAFDSSGGRVALLSQNKPGLTENQLKFNTIPRNEEQLTAMAPRFNETSHAFRQAYLGVCEWNEKHEKIPAQKVTAEHRRASRTALLTTPVSSTG